MSDAKGEQIKALYAVRSQKAMRDGVWAKRPADLVPASALKAGDAIYSAGEGMEFVVLGVRSVSNEFEVTVGSLGGDSA